jgi:hypothetical protein
VRVCVCVCVHICSLTQGRDTVVNKWNAHWIYLIWRVTLGKAFQKRDQHWVISEEVVRWGRFSKDWDSEIRNTCRVRVRKGFVSNMKKFELYLKSNFKPWRILRKGMTLVGRAERSQPPCLSRFASAKAART